MQVVTVDGAGNPVQVPVEFTGTAVSGTGSPNITVKSSAGGAALSALVQLVHCRHLTRSQHRPYVLRSISCLSHA